MVSAFPVLSSVGEAKTTVVARSPLLASAVAHQVAENRLAAGHEVWERPEIYSVDAWLASCWQEARFSLPDVPALLSPLQETALWQSIIEERTPGLFDAAVTARLARAAGSTIAQWDIAPDDEAWSDHRDGTEFLGWLGQFRTKCREEGWITRADLWNLLPQWVEQGIYTRPAIAFAGFTSISPALRRVVQQFRNHKMLGTAEVAPAKRAPVVACECFDEEIEMAARWARSRFEENPAASIGVFVPDLEGHRSVLERTFDRVFYPSSVVRLALPSMDCAFHLHTSARLVEARVVSSALLLLELGRYRFDQASASSVLRSPFLHGAAAERDLRAAADLKLRRGRQLDVSLRELKRSAEVCPILLKSFQKAEPLLRNSAARQSLGEWARLFADVQEAFGWPGDFELTAEEQESVENWKESLSTLATLGLVSGPASYDEALSRLQRIVASAQGSSRGDLFSPVQILDSRDAEGLSFDTAFVAGLSDDRWPPVIDASPLIPLRLQREAGIPGASRQSVQAERKRLTHALFTVAPTIQASYSGQLAPAACGFVASKRPAPILWTGKLPLESFGCGEVVTVEDSNGPPFEIDGSVRGGTSLIKSQSCCPFKAFAEIRLQARTQEDGCFGFDARERGNFLHQALELVWRALKTQARLKAIPDSELRELIHAAVREAVNVAREEESFLQMLTAERARLELLIFEWLTLVERTRLIPFEVEDVERELSFDLAGLPLKIRIDRVDRLKNGSLVLIDYKSGPQKKTKLDCPRPLEPQLLVYAAARGTEVEGVFFGQLRPRDLRLPGIARDRHVKGQQMTAHGNDWDGVMDTARLELERIAKDFLAGKAAVDPAGRSVCSFCTTRPLCRINERNSMDEDSE